MKIIEFCFLATLSLEFAFSDQLLHTVDGDIGRGNYTYYSLNYDGPITLQLHTTDGDADLYVSQLNAKPTYEPDTYCLQSSTCGLDVVYIPASFSRPVGIGVYGHPSFEISSYVLDVYESDVNGSSDSPVDRAERLGDLDEVSDYSTHQEARSESFVWTLIWSFFDIFLEILFL